VVFLCECYACTYGGRRGPQRVSRSSYYLQKLPEPPAKRFHLVYGGGGGGRANALPNDEGGEPGGGDGPANQIAIEARNSSGQGGSSATPGGEHAWSGPAAEGHRFDAEDTPEPSDTSSDPSTDEDPGDVPPPEFVAQSELEYENGPHASPIYQPTVSSNEVRLPVAQFKDYRADLAMYAFTAKHDLTQASVSDLLVLSTSAVEY